MAELGSYKQAHTSSPPLTLGNSRVVEGPAPLKELGSRAQAMRGGPVCHGRPYQGRNAPDNIAPRIIRAHKPLHHSKVAVQGGVNQVSFLVKTLGNKVPSNCQRDFNLLVFDPDGDEVKCRYGNSTLSECSTCTPPSVLSLSPSCTLSFSPTASSNEGSYVVQLVMEDFPSQTITLTQTNGLTEVKTTSDAISKIPVQFAVNVDAAVSSCTEGLYLPKFVAPTPANRARLYTPVNQTLEINISAEANASQISELLFSGPYNTSQVTGGGAGQYMLTWTPSQDEDGESHPICFVVQALFNSSKYHSELRCVIVSVGVGLRMKLSSSYSLSEDYIRNNIIQQHMTGPWVTYDPGGLVQCSTDQDENRIRTPESEGCSLA
ncbi:hypothetical protein L3Q82_003933 [Scortum barcoo]|uniref:Uncharacterized protein n=1 Tax=Scortum barcoo TaxID=214431 RepID=A0ACB8X6Q9_9TELE|nr:hypothetical protein L3Q82_003933 [Scortum barcoo]